MSWLKSVDDELPRPPRAAARCTRRVAKTERVGSDSWITTKVKSAILADSISKGFKVSVKTVNGVVMLSGVLPNDDAVTHVKDLAGKVEGVKSVRASRLKSAGWLTRSKGVAGAVSNAMLFLPLTRRRCMNAAMSRSSGAGERAGSDSAASRSTCPRPA